jgi:alpha/beta hydrolase fold
MYSKISIFIYFIWLSAPLLAQNALQDCNFQQDSIHFSFKIKRDITYSECGYDHQKLDLRIPENAEKPMPLVVVLHGGGFTTGDKTDLLTQKFCIDYAQKGYITAAVNYQLLSDQSFFKMLTNDCKVRLNPLDYTKGQLYDAIRDTRTAIRFLKGNHLKYGIDTSNVYVIGYSAGAIVAQHLVWMDESDKHFYFGNFVQDKYEGLDDLHYPGEKADEKVSALPNGVVAISGALFSNQFVDGGSQEKIPLMMFHGDADDMVSAGEDFPFQKFRQGDFKFELPYVDKAFGITRVLDDGKMERLMIASPHFSLKIPEDAKNFFLKSITTKMIGSEVIAQIGSNHPKLRFEKIAGGNHTFLYKENGALSCYYWEVYGKSLAFFRDIGENGVK